MSEYIYATDEHKGHWLTGEEIVRCRDCRYAIDLSDGTIDCTGPLTVGWDYHNDAIMRNIVELDGFCAWGERKGDA